MVALLGPLINYVAEKDPGLVNAVGRPRPSSSSTSSSTIWRPCGRAGASSWSPQGEPLDPDKALLSRARAAMPGSGKTRMSIISTKFLGATQDIQFWVSQFLVELELAGRAGPRPAGCRRSCSSTRPTLYLPAQRQPPTKGPMEDLLELRPAAAGVGLLLATQSPGDFDYKCRDNIRAWFVGRVKEETALAKMKPMLSDCRLDVAARLPTQETGEFHLIRDGNVTSLRAAPSIMRTDQLPEQEILELARRTRDEGLSG